MRIADLKFKEQIDKSGFYIGFADLMITLCAFFVMIVGMSKIQVGSFEKLKSGFTGDTKGTLVDLAEKLSRMAQNHEGIKVRMAKDGVRLDLDTAILFDSGSAKLYVNRIHSLNPIFAEIKRSKYVIDVEGHTDDVPLYKLTEEGYESNWSLSGRRAASLIHYLNSKGFSDRRVRLIGYGSTRPVINTSKLSGFDKIRGRSKNRRVSLLVH